MPIIKNPKRFDAFKKTNKIIKPKFVEVNKQIIDVNREKILVPQKGLFYTKNTKVLITEIPNFLQKISDIIKSGKNSVKLNGVNSSKRKYSFSIVKQKIPNHSTSSLGHYVLSLETIYGKEKFFIKQGSPKSFLPYNRHAYNEIKSLEILEKNGVNIVKPYFAYLDKASGKSFMVYKYMDPKRYVLALDILKTDSVRGLELFGFISKFVNKVLSHENKINKNKTVADVNTSNILVDIKTNKLYFLDSYLVQNEFSSKK